MNDLFAFAADLVRSQARLLQSGVFDATTRTAPPEGDCRPAFDDLSLRERIQACQRACEQPVYLDAAREAIPESLSLDRLLRLILDPDCGPAEIGRLARGIVLDHLADVAAHRDESLVELP